MLIVQAYLNGIYPVKDPNQKEGFTVKEYKNKHTALNLHNTCIQSSSNYQRKTIDKKSTNKYQNFHKVIYLDNDYRNPVETINVNMACDVVEEVNNIGRSVPRAKSPLMSFIYKLGEFINTA
jgi:hypothetical protein